MASVETVQANGKVCVLDIDVQGVQKVKLSPLQPYYVFIAPPSMEELEKRLRGRGTESEEQIKTRLGNAAKELEYGYVRRESRFSSVVWACSNNRIHPSSISGGGGRGVFIPLSSFHRCLFIVVFWKQPKNPKCPISTKGVLTVVAVDSFCLVDLFFFSKQKLNPFVFFLHRQQAGNFDRVFVNADLKQCLEDLVECIKEWYPHLVEMAPDDEQKSCSSKCIVS